MSEFVGVMPFQTYIEHAYSVYTYIHRYLSHTYINRYSVYTYVHRHL